MYQMVQMMNQGFNSQEIEGNIYDYMLILNSMCIYAMEWDR